ncbi:MAG: hypothetical protein J7J73_02495 [Deltaproteobacteria bacterium]|nr:hypothetical protein [Deltaproteobacteria bacterium]
MEEITVECHSGSRYGEKPITLIKKGKRYNIQRIERMWRTPNALHFTVYTKECKLNILYDELQDKWFMCKE